MEGPDVSSGAGLAASTPADALSEFNSAGGDATPAGDTVAAAAPEGESVAAEPETFDAPEAVEEAVAEEIPGEDTDQATEETPAEELAKPPVDAVAPEELPEGVRRGKDNNGKAGLFVEEPRWKTIYGDHQLVRQVSEVIGEPATAEALTLRNDAFIAQERLYSDLTSGDPAAQGAVLNYFFDEMARAHKEGEVGIDPSVPVAKAFYQTLQQRSPDGYAELRLQAARDLVGEMFREAAANGDDGLFQSAQNFVRALCSAGKGPFDAAQLAAFRATAQRMGIPFYAKAEMPGLAKGADPADALRARISQLESQVSDKSGTSQAAQFETWVAGTRDATRSAVIDEAVKPALASVENAWKPYPEDYKRLVTDPLHREVLDTIRKDETFTKRVQVLHDQARRATSAQVRDTLATQIKQAYVNRAKLAADSHKGSILKFAAQWLKERSDTTHARRQAAQNRTAPGPASGPVQRSLVPKEILDKMGDTYDPRVAARMAQELIG